MYRAPSASTSSALQHSYLLESSLEGLPVWFPAQTCRRETYSMCEQSLQWNTSFIGVRGNHHFLTKEYCTCTVTRGHKGPQGEGATVGRSEATIRGIYAGLHLA